MSKVLRWLTVQDCKERKGKTACTLPSLALARGKGPSKSDMNEPDKRLKLGTRDAIKLVKEKGKFVPALN